MLSLAGWMVLLGGMAHAGGLPAPKAHLQQLKRAHPHLGSLLSQARGIFLSQYHGSIKRQRQTQHWRAKYAAGYKEDKRPQKKRAKKICRLLKTRLKQQDRSLVLYFDGLNAGKKSSTIRLLVKGLKSQQIPYEILRVGKAPDTNNLSELVSWYASMLPRGGQKRVILMDRGPISEMVFGRRSGRYTKVEAKALARGVQAMWQAAGKAGCDVLPMVMLPKKRLQRETVYKRLYLGRTDVEISDLTALTDRPEMEQRFRWSAKQLRGPIKPNLVSFNSGADARNSVLRLLERQVKGMGQ